MNEINSLKTKMPPNVDFVAKSIPHNIEAEQALLGALLVNNDIYYRIASIIKDIHFFDPLHQRIFAIIAKRIQKNTLASPVTIKVFLENDPGLQELGGAVYLVRLAASSVSVFAAKEYAQMIYDMAIRRILISIGEEITNKAYDVSVGTEPATQITEAEQKLYALSEQGQVNKGFQKFEHVLIDCINQANAAYHRGDNLVGIETGFIDLDKKIGGLYKSDLIILAGRPSMGKTALATNIAFNIAKQYSQKIMPNGSHDRISGGVVGFFSLEMSAEQLAGRILSESTEISSHQIRAGKMNEDDFHRLIQTAKDIETSPLYIDDTAALSIHQLTARARRLKRTYGLDLLIIDYLQLVRSTLTRGNRVNEVAEITQGLKAIAKELNVPVLALSQLSRQVEHRDEKRPQLADLRESGSIEQDADVVMFVYRAEYYKEREKPDESQIDKMVLWKEEMEELHGKAEIIISKQRHGPIGTVNLSFESQFTRFGNLAYMPQGGANF